jgi:hypothetical protein
VKTPTTAAAIQAPCQSGSVVSLTLETPLGNPMPEISSVEHDVKNEIKPNVNRNNTYENIRNKIENNESEKISTTDQKTIKNKLNIV